MILLLQDYYRFNKWGYDIQFLAGYSNSSDIVAGAGWSGSIGSVSFRGEASWFQPVGAFYRYNRNDNSYSRI